MCEKMYITPAGEEALKTFKYKGGSDSLFYEYLWSPLCEFIVHKILPSWLAPNLITLAGFLLICLSLAIIQVYSWDYKTDLPSWTLYFAGFSIFTYQILDNVDGKQARKTGSSSPLGMLFDHGCDTTSTWVIGLMIANCIQIGNTYIMFFGLLWMAYLGFFFGMWSQYHIGFMRLSRINAVDEGLVLIESLFFASAIFGQGFWHSITILDLRLNELLIISCSIGGFFQCADFFRSVVVEKSLFSAVSTLGMPASIITVFCTTAFYSPSNSIEQYAYLYIYGFGFLWSKMVGHIQLAHIVEEKLQQWKPTWVAACSIQIVNVWSGYYFGGKCIINEHLLALILLVFGFVIYMHFCICVAFHISGVLNIGILTIRTKDKFESLPTTKPKNDTNPQQIHQQEIEFQNHENL